MKLNCLFIFCSLLLSSCFTPDVIKQEQRFFNTNIANNGQIQHHYIHVDNDQLFYAAAGDNGKPALIIIHGTPGSWHQFSRYLLNKNLLEHFYIVVIDRPGWGKSILGNGEATASYSHQANIIVSLTKQLKNTSHNQAVILMGHSLGASIAPRVAMDYPDNIDGLLLFAGGYNPAIESPRWFNYLAAIPGAHWLIGKDMSNANKEIFTLKKELQEMLPRWPDITSYTIAAQGNKDDLVYPANIDFIKNHLDPQRSISITLANEGHLFPMTMRAEVTDWAICLLKSIQTQSTSCMTSLKKDINYRQE
jgi:pimeloyl-ACP methyl ester carboxylesterase